MATRQEFEERERCAPPQPSASEYEGYHRFVDRDQPSRQFGSFEVFYNGTGDDQKIVHEIGWYWWACYPGCLPDSEPSGPFRTSYLAYVDARGEP